METNSAVWRKSTRSTSTGGECVELAALPEGMGVRDSKDPDGPKLVMRRAEFNTLLASLKR
ncbi:DUF397 domain-containing protein [Actinomadura sp. NAK00032]|uniref:DUF397 domain-containing protein n=1 Tax=Actinomadura sp. NAK00032 TaxID=2742128 RepID=UPI001590E214|nr:DUF397 domain-containing protein [Actinomadura sp. NAK00032]QKW33066.1 DUF397 domain-containing protein [Actinomadura sp. NAK00032]